MQPTATQRNAFGTLFHESLPSFAGWLILFSLGPESMRIRQSKRNNEEPPALPRKRDYPSADDLHMARVRFISENPSVAERDKFMLQLAATFERHHMTFNKMYRLLKRKQKEDSADGTIDSKSIFGWPDV